MKPLAVLSVSGGMDSATLAGYYKHNFDLLFVGINYGQRHVKELESAKQLAEYYGAESEIIDLSSLRYALAGSSLTSDSVAVPDGHYAEETMKATVVPNRNAIMFSILTGIAVSRQADLAAVGIHAGDHFIYPDCRPEFFDPFSETMRAATDGFAKPDFHLRAPFINWTKAQIAAEGTMLGVPYQMTWSCYKGGDKHCGTCGTCVERHEAFELAGIKDPTEYKDVHNI